MPEKDVEQRPLPGQDIVEEAAKLMQDLSFSTQRGAYVEGEHVAVMVSSHPDDENNSVIITCYAFGHWRVHWEGMPVFIKHETGSRIAFLNARGQAVIPNLPPGNYQLSTSTRWGRSREPLPLSAPGPWARIYTSNDGHVIATVARTEEGTLIVSAETRNPDLSGARIGLGFIPIGSAEMRISAELTLSPSEVQRGLWEGRWIQPPALAAASAQGDELLFWVSS